MNDQVLKLNKDNFEQAVLKSKAPVLVDFFADWCGPCQVVAPVIEQLGSEYQDKASVGKVDVDASPELAGQFGIRSIPTLILFKDGEIKETILGAVPKSTLVDILDKHAA